jgi:hypothetical protein
LSKNGGEKDPTPFVKVVEDQEIYNFPIDRLVHFCFEISRNSQSNRDSWVATGQAAPRVRRRAARAHAEARDGPSVRGARRLYCGSVGVIRAKPRPHASHSHPSAGRTAILHWSRLCRTSPPPPCHICHAVALSTIGRLCYHPCNSPRTYLRPSPPSLAREPLDVHGEFHLPILVVANQSCYYLPKDQLELTHSLVA